MKYNPQIHNRRSVRLKGYDYSQEGAYFITICCKDRAHLFGQIINGEMILNANGNIGYNEWLHTSEIRSNVSLDVFVIMPNHIHGIIIINNQTVDTGRGVLHTLCLNTHGSDGCDTNNSDTCNIYQGVCNRPLRKTNVPEMDVCNTSLRSPSNTIGAIVRGYKSAVTKQINILGSGNYNQSSIVWQRSYHEHIIRDEKSYQNISNYIVNNPGKWGEDIFYKE